MKGLAAIVAALIAGPVGAQVVQSREVSFESAGYRLAGTLTHPAKGAVAAGVLVIGGSGPTNRDGVSRLALSAPPAYRQWADALATAGYAVLRYDKRFLTHPGVDFASYDQEVEIADALSAAAFLRSEPGIARVYLVGHSEGGNLATVITARSGGVAGLVVINSVQFPVDELLLAQLEASPAVTKSGLDEVRRLLASIKDGSFPKDGFLLGASGAYWSQWIANSRRSPETLSALPMPVLLVQCLDDETLPGDNLGRNLTSLRAVAQANPRAQLRELRALDHFGMRRGDRKPSPEFMQVLLDWLKHSNFSSKNMN